MPLILPFAKEDAMARSRTLGLFLTLGVATGLAVAGCAKKEAPAPEAAAVAAPTPVGGGKIPVTTASAEAKTEFLQGRELLDERRITDSGGHRQDGASLGTRLA